MRLSEASLRGKVESLTRQTPEEWALVDVAGPFVFELEISAPTPKYEAWQQAELVRSAPAQAALAGNSEKGAKKYLEKRHKMTKEQRRADKQRRLNAVRALVLSGAQVFADGKRELLTEDDFGTLFTAYLPGDDVTGWAKSAAAGYESADVGGDDILESLEARGEALSEALARRVQFWANKAQSWQQDQARDEDLGPLGSTVPSGHGKDPGGKPKPGKTP